MEFEHHVKLQLESFASGNHLDSSSGINAIQTGANEELQLALSNATIHAPWSNVPASVLVKLGWMARDASERARMYEGPSDQRGWREYGGDWLAERGDHEGAFLIGQDKDHRLLSVGCLGRFIGVAMQIHEHNKSIGLQNGTASSVLCLPGDTHVSKGDLNTLQNFQKYIGMHLLSFPQFRAKSEIDSMDTDDEEGEGPLVRLCNSEAEEVTQPVPGTPSDEMDVELEGDDDERIYKLSLPKSGLDREYQRKAIQFIVQHPGIVNLIKAPPGTGKTSIVAAVLCKLMKYSAEAGSKPLIAFLVAPYIDHAKQLLENLKSVLTIIFNDEWESVVEFVGGDDVPDVETLKRAVGGKRVFVSTDKSSELLLQTAKHAMELGHAILCVKDEAHYNSEYESSSTKLVMLAADNSKHNFSVVCTATPDTNVIHLPTLQRALDLPLEEAIRMKYCAPYEVILPMVSAKTVDGEDDDASMPVEARNLQRKDRLGAAALFGVGGMIRQGKRRCIAYVSNKAEAEAMKTMLEEACAFHGVDCVANIVTEETGVKRRKTVYKEFRLDPTFTNKSFPNMPDKYKLTLRFLIGVRILDQCIDLPETDSILIASPPSTSSSDLKSAHRAIQQIGRGTRPKAGNVGCSVFIFADERSGWLQKFFDVLYEFDAGCKKRLKVFSSNPVTCYTPESLQLEVSSVEVVAKMYDIGYVIRDNEDVCRRKRAEELARRIMLKHTKQNDPRTGKPPNFSSKSYDDDYLRTGIFWSRLLSYNHNFELIQSCLNRYQIDLKSFLDKYKHSIRKKEGGTLDAKACEVARLIVLMEANEIDPETGKNARIPKVRDENDVLKINLFWGRLLRKNTHFDLVQSKLSPRGIDLNIVLEKYRNYAKDQIVELARLFWLVKSGSIDETTNKLAQMPCKKCKKLGLGNVWSHMKDQQRTRRHELQAELGEHVDLDGFIEQEKLKTTKFAGKKRLRDDSAM